MCPSCVAEHKWEGSVCSSLVLTATQDYGIIQIRKQPTHHGASCRSCNLRLCSISRDSCAWKWLLHLHSLWLCPCRGTKIWDGRREQLSLFHHQQIIRISGKTVELNVPQRSNLRRSRSPNLL
ncbi:hypothetical protein GDO81_009290 [Engystomops pustulosus]|uniref:Uncharacterized protein n=1 Tax=Engystomops pustulosus TaxID=76066 RepID=A0AAV7BQT6_ENGPU|nr:hypothetical protein GDO81_009290 [Engystomops pustulosus]